jgi:hypothetical protein
MELVSEKVNISNLISCILCSVQIIDLGVGQAFNVDDKGFMDSLYQIIPKLVASGQAHSVQDFLTFLKCTSIVFLQKRQYSNEVVLAFVKRLIIYAIHMQPYEACSVLLLVKQIFGKYPITKNLLDVDRDNMPLNSESASVYYRGDIGDPALANAGESTIIFELSLLASNTQMIKGPATAILTQRLAKSILTSDGLPTEVLGKSAL